MGEVPKPCWLTNGPRLARQTCLPSCAERHERKLLGRGPGAIHVVAHRRSACSKPGCSADGSDASWTESPASKACGRRWPTGTARSACRCSGSALVRKIRSPHSTGDEWPMPGSSTFHRYSFSAQLDGNRRRLALARAVGPAKASPLLGCGQLAKACQAQSGYERSTMHRREFLKSSCSCNSQIAAAAFPPF